MTLDEHIEKRRERVANMTLAQARDLIAETLSHSDMEIEFDKAVQMLLDCADEKINGGWVPVTERLPEEGYSVLVMRITDDSYKYMRVATYQGDCWMDDTDIFNKPNPHKVIAWMPLPQPYKAESEET